MSVECSFEGCGRPLRARGLCSGHWKQAHAGEVLRPLRRRVLPASKICSADGCERIHSALGYCNTHATRVRRFGDPIAAEPISRMRRVAVPTIGAMHLRVVRARGRASAGVCVDCGEPAAEWSYNNADPNELLGQDRHRLMAYSLDVDNYDPRCKPCHRQFDRAHRQGAAA